MSAQPTNRRRSVPRLVALIASLLVGIPAVPWMAETGGGTARVGAISALQNPYVERALLTNPGAQPTVLSSALSSDGSTAVVGYVSAVAIYGKSGATYRQVGPTLTDPSNPATNDAFGETVAASNDGSMVVVGNSFNSFSGSQRTGVVYVYTKNGNAYVELGGAPIATGDATYVNFGTQVAMSGDGATVLVTATDATSQQPKVLVYTKGGGVYSRQQVLTGGTVLALSTDGATLAVGTDGSDAAPGSVAVYARSGGVYSPFGPALTASDGTNTNHFGGRLATSGDGATLAIGAVNSTLHPQQSVAYVFTKGASAYSQGQEIVTVIGSYASIQYGGLALNGDGTLLALGVTHDSALDQTVAAPTTALYQKSGGSYAPYAHGLIGFSGPIIESANYGSLLALSGDGGTLLAGLEGALPPAIFTNAPIAGIGVWRNATWNLLNAPATAPDADLTFAYAYSPPTLPLLCDGSGTNAKQPGLFTSGGWRLAPGLRLAFGVSSDIPLCGDWTGQGKQTVGIFRDGVFSLRNSNSTGAPDIVVAFGQAGDIPVVGDWTGQGKQTVGVYRNGVFYLLNNNVSSTTADIVVGFGQAGDVPVVGDWTGGGIESVGVFRNGAWYLRNTNTTGAADTFFLFGTTGDVPLVRSERANGVNGPGAQPRITPTAVKGTPTAPVTGNAATATPGKGTATPNPLPPSRP